MNFIEIIDRIFVNRNLYHQINDEDKISSFFIINRKLGKNYPEIAKQLNDQYIDKASAIDMWYLFFEGTYKIPAWYWDPKDRKKLNPVTKNINYENLKKREDLNDVDIQYLEKFYPIELEKEIKKINQFD